MRCEFRKLTTTYAIRTREFYDAVARLAPHDDIGPELSELMEEISRLQALCLAAHDELQSYIEQATKTPVGNPPRRLEDIVS